MYVTREAAHGSWNVTPQPAVGLAWTPRSDGSFVERMLGGDKSVLRGGYSFRRFTMPQQFIWDFGSSFGIAFFQNFSSTPGTSAAQGTFFPGSVVLGQPGYLPQSCATSSAAPCFTYAPARYEDVVHLTDLTFQGASVSGMPDDIKQPYTSSWNIGIQRDLGGNRAIEVRYNGNSTRNQWLAGNINEVNIFENGFLNEFKNAKRNLDINAAAGVTGNFGNRGLPGQVDLPIFAATGIPFTNANAVNNLNNGAAGTLANTLATNRDFACSMFGSAIPACGAAAGPGKGYPINFWRANQFATGRGLGDGRQRLLQLPRPAAGVPSAQLARHDAECELHPEQDQWHRHSGRRLHGRLHDFTNRDFVMAYAPVITDRRHVVHVSGTYDLPFGSRKAVANDGIMEKIAGGWTVSTIFTFQSGRPFRIGGNNNTFNNLRDGGLTLNGITPQDIQDRIGLLSRRCGAAVLPAAGLDRRDQGQWSRRLQQDAGNLGRDLLPVWTAGDQHGYRDLEGGDHHRARSVQVPDGSAQRLQPPDVLAGHNRHRQLRRDRLRPRQPERHVAPHRVPGEHRILIRLE